MVGLLIKSPLYHWILLPAARNTMVSTAEKNGIDWRGASEWLAQTKDWEATLPPPGPPVVPQYYLAPFHAYAQGNLCWEAAFEQELAGKAVGIRNFPTPEGGNKGERLFRDALEAELLCLAQQEVPPGATVVDLGCGTGTSTRRLAATLPQAARFIGVDLSPHMLAVGRRLLDGVRGRADGEWIEPVEPDERISLLLADAAKTGLPNESADLVALCLVVHELPSEAAIEVCAEAWRLLRPGGVLWCVEMDGSSPGYIDLRQNPALFALIRATEPYLDAYFDSQEALLSQGLRKLGFERITISAATGRHFCVVARKAQTGASPDTSAPLDLRFDEEGRYRKGDTHLHTLDTDGGKL